MKAILRGAAAIFGFFFGRLNWQAPPWLAAIGRMRREQPRSFWGVLIFLFLAGTVMTGAYYYYESLPKPLRYAVDVEPPGVTPIIDDKPQPQQLSMF